jgi:uncharacterized membrane protein YraQ (UPF0718 family)/copper chaperone CopZ
LQYVNTFLEALWATGMSLAPSMFLGLVIAGILHVFVKRDRIFKHIGKPGLRSALKASLIGVPLPLCSCGVLPAAIALRKDGASKGAAVSFLASTPQTGVDSIAPTWALLGWPVALAKVIAAFIAGVVSGTIVDALDKENGHKYSPAAAAPVEKGSILSRIWKYAFVTLFRDIYVWLFIGVAISAAITIFIPPGQLSEYPVLSGPLGMLAALAIGIPLYVCSVSSVPIAAALIYAGFPVGSAMVFLMSGPATNAATMGAVRKNLGNLSFWSYIITIITVSLLSGFILNGLSIPVKDIMHHHEGNSLLPGISAFFLFLGIAYYAFMDLQRKFRRGKPSSSTNSEIVVYEVSGLTCAGCVRSVSEALMKLSGVSSVVVSLEKGTASVTPGVGYSNEKILKTLEEKGYSGKLKGDEKKSECSCRTCN